MARQPGARAGVAAFARAWARAVTGTSYLPLEQAGLEEFLAGLTERLATGLDAEPFDQRAGEEIGADLVAGHVTAPEGIGRSIAVIDARLLPDLGLAGDQVRGRLARLLGAVAAGHARAMRDRTLDEQESIRRAALLARQQAEAALRESEARFRYQATHDPLTRLPNRTLFTDRLTALCGDRDPGAPPRRLGVCFVDLDGFKVVNDSLGHQVGDALLAAVADRLRRRLADHLVARLGGDEFVILVEDTTCTDDVLKVADAALDVISEPAVVDGHELTISASIGVVERDTGRTTPSEVMRAADATLHWAKSAGKGRWAVFDPARNQRELARYALSAAMPAALDRGEFAVEFRPIVALGDGRDGAVRGVAAQVRWHHPERGVLPPEQFLGLAEETGLILRLGGWVLAEACHQAGRGWRLDPDPPYVSVHLAARQVHDPGLVDAVTAVLDRSGLPPARLQLEITEGAVAGTEGAVTAGEGAGDAPVRALHRLADLGVRIAVDDFGTGYCHLAFLRTLPLCELKLASSLITGLAEPATTTDVRILATLVSLAHTLGLTVTAKGVETAGQAQRLRAVGCDAAQGRYAGPPLPHHRLTDPPAAG